MRKKDALLNAFNEILYGIKNGVLLEDGNVRKYDILDYYQNNYIKNVMDINKNFDKVRDILNKSDVVIFSKFMKENNPGIKLDKIIIKDLLNVKYEINALRDKNGMPIPGTGRVITNTEKEMIINYILDNKLPLKIKIYKLVLKRYVENEIELEQPKKLQKNM